MPGQSLSPGHLRSHDGICWTNENWWSWMWKSPDWRPGLARLTDCWGHCSLLILPLHGPMISKSEMRKIHRVSVMYCYFIFLISFQTRTAQRATYFVLIHYWLTATFLKSKTKLRTFDFNLLLLLDYNLNLQLTIWTYSFNLKLSKQTLKIKNICFFCWLLPCTWTVPNRSKAKTAQKRNSSK